jgi:hypothetical protein
MEHTVPGECRVIVGGFGLVRASFGLGGSSVGDPVGGEADGERDACGDEGPDAE